VLDPQLEAYFGLSQSLHTSRCRRSLAIDAQDRLENGEALAHLREAVKELKDVEQTYQLSKAWLHAWNGETQAIERLKAKFERENATVYYQKVPDVVAPTPVEKVIVKPIPFDPSETLTVAQARHP